jgi:hypothetical protein
MKFLYHTTIFITALIISLHALSAPKALTPAQSLDEDLGGSAVTWAGQIVNSYEVGDEACLVLNKVDDMNGGYVSTSVKFITCTPGSVQDEMFINGKFIEVSGNLGGNILRSISGHTIEAHLIAAPIIKPLANMTVYKNRPHYNDPFFYDPWYPYGGVGIGIGNYHRHRWHRH